LRGTQPRVRMGTIAIVAKEAWKKGRTKQYKKTHAQKNGDASDARVCVTTTTPLSLVQSAKIKTALTLTASTRMN